MNRRTLSFIHHSSFIIHHSLVPTRPAAWPSPDGVRTIRETPPRRGSALARRSWYEGPGCMPKVTFVNENKEIEVPAGANLREEAKKAGINVYWGLAKFLNCFGH